jgi:hypothetical protein
VQKNHVIKLDSNSNQEKSLYEGPKYQLIGKDLPKDKPRPKTVSSSRNRSTRRRTQQVKKQVNQYENKGYIPFGGHGTRVGGGPIHIPRPNNAHRNRIPKPTEDRYSSIRVERNTSYTETSQRNSTNIIQNTNNFSTLNNNSRSNIRRMHDIQRQSSNNTNKIKASSRRNINTKNYQRAPKHNQKIEIYDNKFPGKGTRVGSSGINKSELISEMNNNIEYIEYKKFEEDKMDILEISGKKRDQNIKCFEQSLCFQAEQNGMQKEYEKTIEENLCYHGENEGMYKEIFCPVHGRRLIKIDDLNN